jgi:hypothetical protein
MKTILLFFFILLMATLKAVINREVVKLPIRKIARTECIDRSVPNVIEPLPIQKVRLFYYKSNLKWTYENT